VKYFLSGMKIALIQWLVLPRFCFKLLAVCTARPAEGVEEAKTFVWKCRCLIPICMCMLTSLCSSEMKWNYYKTAAALSVLVVSVTLSCEFNLLI
jgi:hypothetical protein